MPVSIPQRKGEPLVFSQDECARETSYEALAKMKPAFKKEGFGTAGNASIISDGAAAVVVMSRQKAEALGCTIMATVGAQASYGIDMRYVLVAPIWAIPKCLKKEGIDIDDVDLFEVNEAFSGSTVAVMKELELAAEKTNVNGGAIATGHPLGATGAVLTVKILGELKRRTDPGGLFRSALAERLLES